MDLSHVAERLTLPGRLEWRLSADARFFLVLALLFASGILTHVHGYSLTQWHNAIDGSPQSEVLVGKARAIRSDDYTAYLPNVFSQIRHSPAFPVVNTDIGRGENMLVYPHMPVRHPLVLFRPDAWGYFFGADTGLAWQWWWRTSAILLGFFLLFRWIPGCGPALAALGAVATLFAPFVQFWALNSSEMLSGAALASALTLSILFREIAWDGILLRVLALIWIGGIFALSLYPAFQIPLLYAYLGTTLTLIAMNYRRKRPEHSLWPRLGALALAGAGAIGVCLYFFSETKTIVDIIRHTAYPGARHELGGGIDFVAFFASFSGFYAAKGVVSSGFGNICEAASFFFFLPLCLVTLAVEKRGDWRALAPLIPLTATFLFFAAWVRFGFREPFPTITLLSAVPAWRTLVGFGFLNAVAVVIYLAEKNAGERGKTLLLGLWLAFLASFALLFKQHYPSMPLWLLLPSVAIIALVGKWFLFRHRFAGRAFLVISIASSVAFNPWVHGGTEFLFDNPLSRKMEEVSGEDGNRGAWVVVGTTDASFALANLPKALGLHTLSGEYFYPQLELWRTLDPKGKQINVYNRYANTTWEVGKPGELSFSSPTGNDVHVKFDPTLPVLRKLSLRNFLVVGNPGIFAERSDLFEHRFSYFGKHIYCLRKETR